MANNVSAIIENWKTLFFDDYRPFIARGLVKCGPSQLIELLSPFLTDLRKQKIEEVLDRRSSMVSIVLDGLYNPGNRNAIVRTVESFGHNWLHCVEQDSMKLINRTTQGADQWIHVPQWKHRSDLVNVLKKNQIKIITASLAPSAIPLQNLKIDGPSVIVLGNEALGPSPEFVEASDLAVKIDSVGMTQSFNVSVAAAIISWEIFKSMKERSYSNGLSKDERLTTKAYYYLTSVPGRLRENLLLEKSLI